MNKANEFILWFNEISIDDVPLVGGKNASLGEMYEELTKKGVNIPNGFALTAHAYDFFIAKSKLHIKITKLLKKIKKGNIKHLHKYGSEIRSLILDAEFPEELKQEVKKAYEKLSKEYKMRNADVAVRSSATAEDLPDASFAGQQETYLNIKGYLQVIEACKKCIASLFTDRAISYRVDKGFNHVKIKLSVGVQKMVRSDKASSGVMFTLDTESGFENVVYVTAAYGLGENIVQGNVNPDEYYVFKPTLKKGFKPIIRKQIGSKEFRLIYDHTGNKTTKNITVEKHERKKIVLEDKEILKLAEWGVIIEEHYSKKANKYKPMDIEWAKDGESGKLYIVQARPETVQSQKDRTKFYEYKLKKKGKVLITGDSVGSKVGTGEVNVIKNVHKISQFKKGQILVTEMTDPDWEPIMKIASGIITNRGGRTCHAAIVSRELGIPCIVGTIEGTKVLKNKEKVTVDCSQGETGFVYKGKVPYQEKAYTLNAFRKTRTKIMLNLGNPEEAFNLSFIPNEGVGLAREEFIINSYIKIHPLVLIDYDKIKQIGLKKEIDDLTFGYKDKTKFYIDKLAEGIAMLCSAFYPKDVIMRFSDFKSNEYANLIGGRMYEPNEDNPMIGWRGASRYYDPKFKKAFALECKAVKKVREEFGLKNLKVMVPFCRTIDEGKKVLKEMKLSGLEQGKEGLEVYVMCEIPSNVILADEFANIFDGFSIGTNDLTQLTLGLDRDSEIVADIYDERNPAVKRLVSDVISVAKNHNRKIGICGDAPSTFDDFAQFLVQEGIDSISLSPDAVLKTTLKIIEKEKELGILPKLN
jgi:pyruvate, water dikinase